jgi:hypothetical protein
MSTLGPWEPQDLNRLVASQTFALGVLLVGLLGSARADSMDGKVPWVALAAAGVAISGVANGRWLLRGRQVIGVAVRDTQRRDLGSPRREVLDAAPEAADQVVLQRSRAVYHRAGCAFVDGREGRSLQRSEVATSQAPCPVCRP